MLTGVYPIRLTIVVCHLLVDHDGCVLIDTGLVGEPRLIRRVLRKLGRKPTDIRAILLTHGHLDHAGNLYELKRETGAIVYGHQAEQAHIDGNYPYTGASRVCGWLETFGRAVLRYRHVTIDRTIGDSDVLPFWGGLEVIHLPGHTKGHCGFYSAKYDLLFAGDLFVSGWLATYRPPWFLNSVPDQLPASYHRVAAMSPKRILTNHYDYCDADRIKRRFDRFYQKHYGNIGSNGCAHKSGRVRM